MKNLSLVGVLAVSISVGGALGLARADGTSDAAALAKDAQVAAALADNGIAAAPQPDGKSNAGSMKIAGDESATTEASVDADKSSTPTLEEIPSPPQLSRGESHELLTGFGQFTYGLDYDNMVPLYVEECSFSQWDRQPEDAGGSGGHAALYIKGVEPDPTYVGKYPRLRLRKELADAKSIDDVKSLASNPDWGAGASVDKTFRNVNWVAIPGKSLFLRGLPNYTADGAPVADCDLQATNVPSKTLFGGKKDPVAGTGLECKVAPGEKDALNQTIDAVYPYFRDVTVTAGQRAHLLKEFPDAAKGGDSMARAIANDSIGTDYAITFAREAYCVRMPMGREGITRVVDYLNSRNDLAFAAWEKEGKNHPDKTTLDNGNVWDGINNNCTHMVHNALAAIGIRHTMVTFNSLRIAGLLRDALDLGTLPFMIFQIATPANEFVTLARMSNGAKLSHGHYVWDNAKSMDPEHIFGEKDKIALVEDPIQAWMPMQPGAMVEPIYQIPQGDVSKDPRTWQNQIFIPHESTMTILDVATIPGAIPYLGSKLAAWIRKTPLAPRKTQLDYIMDRDNKENPYTQPLAHVEFFSKAYGSLKDKYCRADSSDTSSEGAKYYANKTAKSAEFKTFLDTYCEFVQTRLELLARYKPQIESNQRKVSSSEAAIATFLGPAMRNGKLLHVK